jgi:hypothetical protein
MTEVMMMGVNAHERQGEFRRPVVMRHFLMSRRFGHGQG